MQPRDYFPNAFLLASRAAISLISGMRLRISDDVAPAV
jgi:hypothetical protein